MTTKIQPLTCEYQGFWKPKTHLSLDGKCYIVEKVEKFHEVMFEIGLSLSCTNRLLGKIDLNNYSYIIVYKATTRPNVDYIPEIEIVAEKIHFKFMEVVPPKSITGLDESPSFFLGSSFRGTEELMQSAQVCAFKVPKMQFEIEITMESTAKELSDLPGFEEVKNCEEWAQEIRDLEEEMCRNYWEVKVAPNKTTASGKVEGIVLSENIKTRRYIKEITNLMERLRKDLKEKYQLKMGQKILEESRLPWISLP